MTTKYGIEKSYIQRLEDLTATSLDSLFAEVDHIVASKVKADPTDLGKPKATPPGFMETRQVIKLLVDQARLSNQDQTTIYEMKRELLFLAYDNEQLKKRIAQMDQTIESQNELLATNGSRRIGG